MVHTNDAFAAAAGRARSSLLARDATDHVDGGGCVSWLLWFVANDLRARCTTRELVFFLLQLLLVVVKATRSATAPLPTKSSLNDADGGGGGWDDGGQQHQ